jgi:CRISPR-associated endonuclease/helicase Cas3
VTECASLDALRQRFGRLDRLGELGESHAVVVAGSTDIDEEAPPDPIYGEALRETWRWLALQGAEADDGDGRAGGTLGLEVGIAALDARLATMQAAELRPLLAPRPMAPLLTPSHLDRWAQTSPIPSADPDVASFLHGPGRGSPDVQVVWRADLEADLLDEEEKVAGVRAMLTVVPPSALEGLPVPLWAARSWLEAVASARAAPEAPPTAVPAVADVEGVAEPEEEPPLRIAPALLWRGDDTVLITAKDRIRPGDTLVVPSSYGGLDARWQCWDPAATDPVRDRGDEAQLLHRGRAVLRWSPAVLRGWCPPGPLGAGPALDVDELNERGADGERDAFEAWRADVLAEPATPGWARLALEALAGRGELVRVGEGGAAWRASAGTRRMPLREIQRLSGISGLGASVSPGLDAGEATTEDDGGSFTRADVSLDKHLSGVRAFADRFAEALALPADVAGDVALAGWLHDLGKADSRFQLWLHGGDPVAHALAMEPLAKSRAPLGDRATRERARQRAGYPSGARHELTSVALVQHSDLLRARANDWDLVLHLVASHHGWCRPFAPPAVDAAPVDVKATLDGVTLATTSDHRLVRIDSGVAERFWELVRSYGWWGLAWLEAVVRLADHRESEREARDG